MLTRCAVPGHPRRRVRPVLLDPLHLHDTTGPLATRGQGRGSPGGHDQVRVTRVSGHVSRVMSRHCSAHDQEDERRYVTYYQWVGFTLFFQVSNPPRLPSSSEATASGAVFLDS